jgi:hypothetical protein
VTERYGDTVDRINAYSPFDVDDGLWALVRQGFAELSPARLTR